MTQSPLSGGRAGIALTALLAALATLLIGSVGAAEAKRITGTKGPDKIRGTSKGDRINAKGGKDVVAGRNGRDRIVGAGGADKLSGAKGGDSLSGGGGSDRLKGGQGRDQHGGGSGNDFLDAVDGGRDRKIDGGSGKNTCRLDMEDLEVAKRCDTIRVPSGAGGPDEPGAPGTPAGGLTITRASGLTCGSALPTCLFELEGEGADALLGTVTGGDGVTLGVGVSLSIEGDGSWLATGAYGCTSDGLLRVTIGSESVDVPVTCTTS